MAPSTFSATSHLLHSLFSLFLDFLSGIRSRSGTWIILYSILGIGGVLFSLRMLFPILRRFPLPLSREESSGPRPVIPPDHVVLKGPQQRSGGISSAEDAVRSAPRAGTQPLQKTSNRIQKSLDAQARPHTHNLDYRPSATKQQVSDATYLSESLSVERSTAFPPVEFGAAPNRYNIFPPEILTIIFQYVHLQHEAQPGHSLSTLLSLRGVCKEWKSLIEGTAKLWPPLFPPLDAARPKACVEWYIDVAETLSKQANGLDLVVLMLPKYEQEIHRDLFNRLLNLAIRALEMKVIVPDCFCRRSTSGPTSFLVSTPTERRLSDGPVMERLERVEWIMTSHPFADQLPQAPELPWSSLRQLPWAQLTHVYLDMSMTPHDCEFILDHATRMEHLTLSHVADDPLPTPDSQMDKKWCPVQSLTMVASTSVASLLQRYHMPDLRKLDLELGGSDSAMDLSRNTIPWGDLVYLSLNCTLSVGVLEDVIGELSSVEELVLKGRLIDDDNAPWSLSYVLESLKLFTLIPTSDAFGHYLMTQLLLHNIPVSIESINAPLDLHAIRYIIYRPTTSLRNIDLQRRPILPEVFLSFLSHCTNLVAGSFHVHDREAHSGHRSIYPGIMSNIQSLHLHLDYRETGARPLLDALTLPKLHELKIGVSKKSQEFDGWNQLLTRSGCAISKLNVDCPHATDTCVSEMLMIISSTLESFEIKSGHGKPFFGEKLWMALTHQAVNPTPQVCSCLCPRLEHLVVSTCKDVDLFYEMLESRASFPNDCGCGLRKLRHVEAVLNDEQPQRRSQAVSHFKAKNLVVKFEQTVFSDAL